MHAGSESASTGCAHPHGGLGSPGRFRATASGSPAAPRSPAAPGLAQQLTARRAASRRRCLPPAGTPTACAGRAGSRSRRPGPPGRPSSRSAAARSARSTASPTGGPGLPPQQSPSYARPAATAATASAAATANGTRWEVAPGRGPAYGHPLPSPGPPSNPARLSGRPGLLPAHLAFPPTPPPQEPGHSQVGPSFGSSRSPWPRPPVLVTPSHLQPEPRPACCSSRFNTATATPQLRASFSLLETFLLVQ